MNKLFAAALLILSGSTVFVSAQEATKDQDKARTPPKYYPTEFQISGSDSGAPSGFMLDQNARLFYCYMQDNVLKCVAPFQLPQFTTGDVLNPPQFVKYFLSPTHKSGGSNTMVVSSFGVVRWCYTDYYTAAINCSSPVSLN